MTNNNQRNMPPEELELMNALHAAVVNYLKKVGVENEDHTEGTFERKHLYIVLRKLEALKRALLVSVTPTNEEDLERFKEKMEHGGT